MRYQFYLVDSFTQTAGQGNPAGVVFHDGALGDADMRGIAGKLERETAFLHREEDSYRIQFYTAEARVPLCGHDTIATGVVLSERGEWKPGDKIILKSDIGDLPIERSDEAVWMTQRAPELGGVVNAGEIADLLGLPADAVLDNPLPRVVSTGTPFLFARLAGVDVIQALRPDFNRISRYLRSSAPGAMGLYVWSLAAEKPDTLHGRCFAPVAGLPEDPVTGSASGALASYWAGSDPARREHYRITVEQGWKAGRNGIAIVDVTRNNGRIEEPRVGGGGVVTEEGAGDWEPQKA